ncbi:MAG TPA: carboxypeptidase regulatory-like domain-containing protein [Sediminibacterium sp.]|nr:carboxypeptidase regulatory-like domain-containing protein [Sediminibacterium sp.]
MHTRVIIWVLCLLAANTCAFAQWTTGRISGTADDGTGLGLPGTAITVIDSISGFTYQAIAGRSGRYLLENIPAGDQYLLTAAYSGYADIVKRQVSVRVGETTIADLQLLPSYSTLSAITVTGYRHSYAGADAGTRLSPAWRENQPGREWIHYLRNQPGIRIMPGTEDAISLGGQNNRYNAFYIDGAVLNDVYGLSASGTNGGTTGASPVSMESIDQIVVTTTPYDASFGKFTGGIIQMTTHTGTKEFSASCYNNWSPGWLSGKLPQVVVPYTRGSEYLSGIRLSGRLRKHWVYFFNREIQESVYPQALNWQQYPGSIADKTAPDLLRHAMEDRFGYDPGNYDNTPTYLHADRLFMRVDGKPTPHSSIMLSFRYSSSRRDEQGNGNSENITYGMHGYSAESSQQVLTAEWKTRTGSRSGNRLLATYTRVSDRRLPAGRPFPELRIYDGEGSLLLGSDNNAAFNYLKHQNITLFEQWHLRWGNHMIRIGMDAEFDQISNTFLQNSFGRYSYGSLNAFLSGYAPAGYEAGFVLWNGHSSREAPKAVRLNLLRTAFFLGDECRISGSIRIYIGIRLDKEALFAPESRNLDPDPVFEEQVRNTWHIESIAPGRLPVFPIRLVPRFQWWWSPVNKTSLTMGIGLFTGKMPLAWLAAPLLHNGADIGGWKAGNAALRLIRFSQDTDHSWLPESLGEIPNQVPLDLAAPALQMPSLLRCSASFSQKLNSQIKVILTGTYSLPLATVSYTNINLLPPPAHIAGPDNRPAYSYTQSIRIPVSQPTGNPYESAIYLHNEFLQKEYAYEGTIKLVGSPAEGIEWEAGYSYGRSCNIHDGNASVLFSNWRFRETVNGRNYPVPSVSDYSPGHHVTGRYVLHLSGKRTRKPWILSITYNGQSGLLFSYTYMGRSLQKEDETTGNYELMYIPQPGEIRQMHFQPFAGAQAYYPEQVQRQLLETFLSQNRYFTKRRGQYASRNGARTSWEHTVDFQLRKTWRVRWDRKYLQVGCSLTGYNFLNLVNPAWGVHNRVSYDNYALLQIAGFQDREGLVPIYLFNPEKAAMPVWQPVNGRKSAYRSQWSFELGFRISI